MQKLQESIFSIIKTTSLAPAVFNFLQPTEDYSDKTLPLGGILRDTKYGWLALGPKFCVVDLRSGIKVAATTFGNGISNSINVTSVIELPKPLTDNSQTLIISLDYDGTAGLICIFHINGSQLLRCIKTDVVITELAVCCEVASGPLLCFDGLLMAGTCQGEIFVLDLNRSSLIQDLTNISQGNEDLARSEENANHLIFLPLKSLHKIESQRDLAIENDNHIGLVLNEDSFLERQFIFRNPDGSVRMKANQNHIRVTVLQYIPQLDSLAVGFNFGAFQIWNMQNLELEYTSQVNVECLPVTQFGFQEPCDDPRAFCYLWVVFSVIDRFEEEEFPLAVMYSMTYRGKRMITETKSLYQDFLTATIRFQIELCAIEDVQQLIGGRCISCHTYSISSTLGEEGEDTMLNLCQLVWECWGESAVSATQYCMLLFDLDQWYKDQMPATYQLESSAFMSTGRCPEISRGTCTTLDLRLDPQSVSPYSHATRLEEHFYPNSLQYNCICLNTSEASTINTVGVQRQILSSISSSGPSCLLSPEHLHAACSVAGLTPLYCEALAQYAPTPEEQRHFLLSIALEARLSRFLKRCAHDWATGTHSGVGCTLSFLVDWCWKRAIELKDNAKELTAPLFTSSTLPDRNVLRCLEHCVQQLTALTGLLDAVLTKCCNLVVPDALSEMEEKYKGIGTVSLYFQVVQWFVRVGLLPERLPSYNALPYPAHQLYATYKKRRIKLNRLQDKSDEDSAYKSCSLLYIDQLIEHEFGGERVHMMWLKGGSECGGLYPPPSLYSLLRLYLIPDIALEHKHSLLLYLLLDYSMLYDEMREAVIRRLMQFPTMFGLSNTAIKATQAFWHLDHRDFDFALDQLQCLTGNTLSDWQHNVVLSSLLVQKKTQAALQYLHVRKPAPLQIKQGDGKNYDHDKLDDWQSCCSLYLARGLVFEALDVIRMCVQNAASVEDKTHLLNFFYKGCRNTGQLSKVLQVTLVPFEEEVFIKYLQDCNDPQTSELLVMYYLQQARYLEAEQYNNKMKSRGRPKEMATSVESLLDVLDREGARDSLVEIVCSSLPKIATSVARCALTDFEPHIVRPKPMSVYVQAQSPKNAFTYKSSFIQNTIENASETWINKPKFRKGMKRALNIQDTPFICTPKTYKSRSLLAEGIEATPAKRPKLDLSGTPITPKTPCNIKVSETLTQEMASLLDMPEVQSPHTYYERNGADTPQSILKNRRLDDQDRDAPSPADSRYLCDSDEDLETGSNQTHYSDSTNKHLRFTIPTVSEGGSTPSPVPVPVNHEQLETTEEDSVSGDSSAHRTSSYVSEAYPMESPPKRFAAEGVRSRKSYKDNVKARRSLSISANSSLSEDPNSSIESIADIPITLINPKYSGGKMRYSFTNYPDQTQSEIEIKWDSQEETEMEIENERKIEKDSGSEVSVPQTPKGRRSIRSSVRETTPSSNSHLTLTPERMDSPIMTSMQRGRTIRSRSRTPELSPRLSPLAPIPEQPKQEVDSEPHPKATTLSIPRQLRSRSRTPERLEKTLKDPPLLEAIKESPTKPIESPPDSPSRRSLRSRSRTPERLEKPLKESPLLEAIKESPTKPIESPPDSPSRRSLRSRSRTPEVTTATEQPAASPRSMRSRSRTPDVEMEPEQPISSPRTLRSRSRTPDVEITTQEAVTLTSPRSMRGRSKTPEKLLSPKKEYVTRTKKSLSRMVLEANTFSKTKQVEIIERETIEEQTDSIIECTPMKSSKEIPSLMDINFSPIFDKSVLQSPSESLLSDSTVTTEKAAKSDDPLEVKSVPAFTTINQTDIEKSILQSYHSSVDETSSDHEVNKAATIPQSEEDDGKSILHSLENTITESKQDKDMSIKDKIEAMPNVSFKIDESLLSSCESSIAETNDSLHNVNKNFAETYKEASCITTSDSEVEVKDNWKTQMETQARVIQKEKESIVEIEREINEIEGEMSDDCRVESDSTEEEEEESSESSDESDEDSEEEEENVEIISINDSDASSDTNKLQIDEQSSDAPQELPATQDQRDLNKFKEIEPEAVEIPAPDLLNVELFEEVDENKDKLTESNLMSEDNTTNQLNQAQMSSMLTDDNSVIESDNDSIHLDYSAEQMIEKKDFDKRFDDMAMEIDQTNETPAAVEIKPSVDVTENKTDKQTFSKDVDIVDAGIPVTNFKDEEIDNKKEGMSESVSNIQKDFVKIDENIKGKEAMEEIQEKNKDENTESSKKLAKSSDYNKSEHNIDQDEVSKSPATRKRTQSTTSIKSENEQKTPEHKENAEVSTPSRRRSKTPTERRLILTRRASKELIERGEDVSMFIDDEVLTPRRRSNRSRSKKEDDSISVTSDSSVKSTRSKASEDAGDIKGTRKQKQPVLKPELTVIPEVVTEDSKQDVSIDYPNTRRLTRNQKALLENKTPRTLHRRTSISSRSEIEDDDASSNSALDEGSLDAEEIRMSPDSTSTIKPRARLARAASETKASPKPVRATRRISVDIATVKESGSPLSLIHGRRASFNRACEALHTPKGRRPSTELRKGDVGSQQGSPGSEAETPTTPGRRGRRASNTQI